MRKQQKDKLDALRQRVYELEDRVAELSRVLEQQVSLNHALQDRLDMLRAESLGIEEYCTKES